ncbi:MAG: hypothetical protein ACOC83_05410, partial [Gemmatimonadota bacterium]
LHPGPMPASEPAPSRSPAPPGADPRPPGTGPPEREPSVHRLYARASWATLGALPLVSPRDALAVESQIISLCRRLDVEPMEVRARARRVDVLFRFKPVHLLADVAGSVKRGSSAHLRRSASPARWGRGIAVRTVAPDEVRSVMRRMALLGSDG